MESLTAMREAIRARRRRRRDRDRLRRELGEVRTSSERHEIEAILERYGTTVDDLIAGREPPVEAPVRGPDRAWEDLWDEIVLDLSSDD
jgi:hypothetical protein